MSEIFNIFDNIIYNFIFNFSDPLLLWSKMKYHKHRWEALWSQARLIETFLLADYAELRLLYWRPSNVGLHQSLLCSSHFA